MELQQTENDMIQTCLNLTANLIKLPVRNIWIDYDKEADVLYLSFRKPQRAKKTVEAGDDILVRTDEGKIVGITILNASDR
jgi:uncharacterized protein YuzE